MDSVATPPTVRAEWAFKIFDSDGDQLLNENDIRCSFDNQCLFSPHGIMVSWQERGGCDHRDGRDSLQESRREGETDGGQERPQVRQS